MNANPGAGGSRSFRRHSGHSQAAPPGDAAPTERFTSLGPGQGQRPPEQPARAQRTRRTVDLSAATHRALDIWQREAADRLGVARVTGQEVITALIDQLLADPKLGAQITRAIQARR